MNGGSHDSDTLYIHCDAAMDYDSQNSGGVGFTIIFPDFMELENIEKFIGRYVGANIERLELEAILQGMNKLLKLYKVYPDKFKNLRNIIITTDRSGLDDEHKTNIYRIQEWRRNKWHNYEGKAIKNSDLLDDIDKARRKIISRMHRFPKIKYQPEKYNKVADRLARAGKRLINERNSIATWGIKVGKRIFDGGEVNYVILKARDKYHIHVFKKELVRNQWEINVEVCEGKLTGQKFKICSDALMQNRMHRHHHYFITIEKSFSHHVTIYKNIEEIKTKIG